MLWTILILFSIPVLIEYYAEEYRKENLSVNSPENSTDYYLPHVESFDFIVVGAGAAGCILASRLSENLNFRVLLLEAGGNPPPQTEIPAYSIAAREYTKTSSILYDYLSVPQKHANNSVIRAFQGKVMGGSGTVNTMWFNRGHPKDFDNWADITGDSSWSYNNVLKHFKSIENYQGEFEIGDPNNIVLIVQQGKNGPMTISKQNFAPGRTEWFAAGQEVGYQTGDPNGPQMTGFMPIEYNKKNGRRHSSYLAYIKPHESQRENLKIIRYAEVMEILIDANNQANGVMFRKHGTYRAAYSTKETILSAGTYGSPQVLMRSGIGPEKILRKAKIQTKVNLPVGEKYQNHPIIGLQFFTEDKSILLDPDTEYNQTVVDDFKEHGTGPLTSFRGLTGQAFLTSSVAVSENQKDWPDYQIYVNGHLYPTTDTNEKGTPLLHTILIGRPKCIGHFSIDPENITGPPIIDFQFLRDKRDLQIFMDAIKFSLNLYESTKVYKDKGVRYTKVPVPACRHLPFRSNQYWECYIRNGLASGLHPSGTCAMGRNNSDPKAVVDSKLRVIGVKGLRVADASIMPEITNANLQAAVYMIAEKTAAEIRSTWKP